MDGHLSFVAPVLFLNFIYLLARADLWSTKASVALITGVAALPIKAVANRVSKT